MQRFRTIMPLTLVLLAFGAVAIGDPHEGKPGWFDPAHCEVCQPMHERPDLMMSMEWGTYKLKNGMMMTAVIPESKQQEFHAVCQKMHEVHPGADAELCGFCQAFGGLVAAGAKMEEVKTNFGNVTLVTSDDPQLVAKIHAMADRTIAETAKMAEATE